MEKITEKILWNDILKLMDKYKHYFMIKTVHELEYVRFKLDTDSDGTLKLIVTTPTTTLASAEAMTAIALIMIKYHPDVRFKLYRASFDTSFNQFMGKNTDCYLIEFDPFETIVGMFMTTSLIIIRSIALNEVDEDLIKYVVPHLNKIVVDNSWLKFCDDRSLLESKALILRYANYNDDTEDMKL
jgi:hypothetical protein